MTARKMLFATRADWMIVTTDLFKLLVVLFNKGWLRKYRGLFYKWSQKAKSAKLPSQVSEHLQKQPSSPFSFEEHFVPVMLKPPSLANASNVSPRIEVTLSQRHHLSIQGPFY